MGPVGSRLLTPTTRSSASERGYDEVTSSELDAAGSSFRSISAMPLPDRSRKRNSPMNNADTIVRFRASNNISTPWIFKGLQYKTQWAVISKSAACMRRINIIYPSNWWDDCFRWASEVDLKQHPSFAKLPRRSDEHRKHQNLALFLGDYDTTWIPSALLETFL